MTAGPCAAAPDALWYRFPVFIAPEYIEKMKAFDRKWLEKVQALDPGELSGEDRVSYDIFLYDRRMSLRDYQYPGHLIPVNQFFSMPNFFAQMGSGQSAQPFNTVEDYDNFLGRIVGFTDWVDQAIANMQKGVEQASSSRACLWRRPCRTSPRTSSRSRRKASSTARSSRCRRRSARRTGSA